VRGVQAIHPPVRQYLTQFWPLTLCVIVALGLSCCRRDNRPTVVLYCSADQHIARQIIDAFEKETGIRVLMVGDTEVKKTAGLIDRLRAERDKPLADVFWSSEIFMTIELAEEGVLEPHISSVTADWPAPFKGPENRWHGFGSRARVIVYAPDRVPADRVPTSWMDLTNEAFRGRVVMADPRFGTTGGHLGAMKAFWTREIMPGYYEAFLEGLAENHVRMLPSGNAGVVAAVANGEADVGMTDTDDVWAAQQQGRKVELVYPLHSIEPGATGVGTLLIPNTVARVKGGPSPTQASKLIDFLLSENTERMLAESVSHNIPVRPDLAKSFPQYQVPDPLRVDYAIAAKLRPQAVSQAMKRFEAASDTTAPPDTTRPDEAITPLKDESAESNGSSDAR
jgi:iron(III) transport system substrate-binding protein